MANNDTKCLSWCYQGEKKIVDHLESLPANWFREVDAFADIIYVVGGKAVQAETTMHRLVLDEDGTLQFGVLTLGQASDVEYPPLTKTTMAYEFFSTRYEYDFVLKCDDDTYIHPSRHTHFVVWSKPEGCFVHGASIASLWMYQIRF